MPNEESGERSPGRTHAPSPTEWWRRVFIPASRRLLREPLFHFVLIGAALFGAYAYSRRGRTGIESSKEIIISLEEVQQMDDYFESQWHRPPTGAELQAMVEGKIREEVLYREGLAMGLDRDDEIVKRRMAQKMEFLSEDMAAAHEPGAKELRSWFEAHRDKFALPGRYSFRHLYFSPDKRGTRAREDAARALVRIAGQPEDSRLAASLADPFMLQDYYADRTPEALAKEFGPQFALALEKLKPGGWQGPVESGFGWHLVFIDILVPGRIPPFEELEPEVKTAWLAEQKERAWREAYAQMRAKYTVLIPGPPDSAIAPSSVPPVRLPPPGGGGGMP